MYIIIYLLYLQEFMFILITKKYIKKWIAIVEFNLNNLLMNINILRIYLFNEVVKQYKMQ